MCCENCCSMKERIGRLEKALSGAEVFIPPTLDQVAEFLREKRKLLSDQAKTVAEEFMMYCESNNWKCQNGEQAKEWRSMCSAWFNNQNLESAQSTLEDQINYKGG